MELDKTNLIKIRSLPSHETLDEFLNKSTWRTWM